MLLFIQDKIIVSAKTKSLDRLFKPTQCLGLQCSLQRDPADKNMIVLWQKSSDLGKSQEQLVSALHAVIWKGLCNKLSNLKATNLGALPQ